ncbi:hypothetical protein GH714_018907 [Hevea brasiliensis]|uniref:TF-B3 domain-containing protein n=1 Tax=Hevea brasiliensis TaxID=3981 RepID=A0A6A6N121_HEVBR|nr:hypothetical protein GH714_018907 [Hevea brasiliensis]
MKDIIPMDKKFFKIVFSKQLTATDLEHQLIVPSDVLKKYPILRQNEFVIISFDQNEKQWEFPLATRKTGKYAKPTMPAGSWHPFVQEFGLRAGDAVVFYISKCDEAGKIQVRGMRQTISLMGTEVWNEVEKNEKQWEFPLATRKTGKYAKPTMPAGSWHPFVQEFGLRAGDAVVFYISKCDEAGKIQVRGMRQTISLMGTKVWNEVEKVDNQA